LPVRINGQREVVNQQQQQKPLTESEKLSITIKDGRREVTSGGKGKGGKGKGSDSGATNQARAGKGTQTDAKGSSAAGKGALGGKGAQMGKGGQVGKGSSVAGKGAISKGKGATSKGASGGKAGKGPVGGKGASSGKGTPGKGASSGKGTSAGASSSTPVAPAAIADVNNISHFPDLPKSESSKAVVLKVSALSTSTAVDLLIYLELMHVGLFNLYSNFTTSWRSS
jgi:hypothetical protein